MTSPLLFVWVLFAGIAFGALVAYFIVRARESGARLAQLQRETFLAAADERVSSLVAPVSQKLSEFAALIREVEQERAGAYEGLKAQIGGLIDRSGKMEAAACELASALRNPKSSGSWGEVQLRRVAQLAGMEAYCDYGEQQTFDIGDERGRPDMTVMLPGDSRIFVDAKVPVNAYLDASRCSEDTGRSNALRAHAAAFKSHVDGLARRNYQRAEGSADFVVMFVPGEAFLSAACVESPELIEYAASKHVFIAGPLTLIALLRSYALGWQHRHQEERAKQIALAGRELYDRVRVFAAHFASIGGNLTKAIKAYNDAVGSMESRVLPAGRKIKELAALPDAELPDVAAVETAPRDLSALDARVRKQRSSQQPLLTDDGVA